MGTVLIALATVAISDALMRKINSHSFEEESI